MRNNVPGEIRSLIARFEEQRESYLHASYKEAQLRKEFIDPMWKALGWDMDNSQGHAEQYKEVIHEDAIKLSSSVYTKAPDYCFRIGGVRKFFLEAKKPAVNIAGDPAPAFQLRSYAWSEKLPLSVLTDFEELSVYDTRIKPAATDKASAARIMSIRFTDYVEKWDEIAGIFSKEAILKGSFDKYAETAKKKRGTTTVDKDFLDQIETWRDELARNIATRNRELSQSELNFAVQVTIDRIVFLRICEDRGIEEYQTLFAISNGSAVYPRLVELFRRADQKYNSGLFHFSQEKGRTAAPDSLTPNLDVDDNVLRKILRSLYYPESPYVFSALPADILGQVYEQFLGKVIRLTPGHQAKVEEKPEVKKAGGVYYTPTYIVDYLVKHTIGPLLDGKTPKQAAGGKNGPIRILDPACGSGTFLLQAYQFLLDWYRDTYVGEGTVKHSKGKSPVLYQGKGGEWRLTTSERKRILLSHIFGVDIDYQAVEVTKLSLLLKVLEGESDQTLQRSLQLFHQRALPDLDGNIRCGNSLIGPDYYDQIDLEGIEDDTRARVNPFNWNTELAAHGADAAQFDSVIGNPPYFSVDATWGRGDSRLAYLSRTYPEVYTDKTDVLFYFIEKALALSTSEVGFIVSRAFLEAYKADKLRLHIRKNADVREIVDFQNFKVFQGVGITTALLLLSKSRTKKPMRIRRVKQAEFRPEWLEQPSEGIEEFTCPQEKLTGDSWTFVSAPNERLIEQIDTAGQPIGTMMLIGKGMETGRNKVFGQLDYATVSRWRLSPNLYYVRARNSDITPFEMRDSGEIVLYLEDVPSFSQLPKPVQAHLLAHETELKERAAFQRGDCDWWRYTWPLHKAEFSRDKLFCPYLAKTNSFAFDAQQKFLGLTDTTVIFDSGQREDIRYVLALLNSSLLTFRFKSIGKLKSGGILEYFWNSISKLPIRRIDFSSAVEKQHHDALVAATDKMVDLKARRSATRLAHERHVTSRAIQGLSEYIDHIVAMLYGISSKDESMLLHRSP